MSTEDLGFTSDANIDKIVNVFEGSFSPGSATTIGGFLKQHSISHGFSRPVYTDLLWSTDNTNWIDGGAGQAAGTFDSSIAYSDSSNVYILTTRTTGTLYYKLICLWIDEYDGSDPDISDYAAATNTIALESDSNYQKIFSEGTLSFTANATKTATHSLTYRPNFRVYIEAISGEVWPANFGGASNPFLYDFTNQVEAEVWTSTTDVSVKFYYGSSTSTRKAWYKIFYDSEKL